MTKKPRIKDLPTPSKVVPRPKWLGPATLENRHVSWRFSCADKGGRWPWLAVPGEGLKEILLKFESFERMDDNSGLKEVRSVHPVDKLPKAAQERLRQLERDDDVERLFSWHLNRMGRLWCAEYDGMMCVLWWDPRHEVYPVVRKR